jgi:hypothetical protein
MTWYISEVIQRQFTLLGPICVRCHKETAQSLLPTAISLMFASKARWTIVENVDKIEIRNSGGFLKDINKFIWIVQQ